MNYTISSDQHFITKRKYSSYIGNTRKKLPPLIISTPYPDKIYPPVLSKHFILPTGSKCLQNQRRNITTTNGTYLQNTHKQIKQLISRRYVRDLISISYCAVLITHLQLSEIPLLVLILHHFYLFHYIFLRYKLVLVTSDINIAIFIYYNKQETLTFLLNHIVAITNVFLSLISNQTLNKLKKMFCFRFNKFNRHCPSQ